jgi:hypothetical protein
MTELWHKCELRFGDLSTTQYVRDRSALVGVTFRIGKERWEVVSVYYPGVPFSAARDTQQGLTTR